MSESDNGTFESDMFSEQDLDMTGEILMKDEMIEEQFEHQNDFFRLMGQERLQSRHISDKCIRSLIMADWELFSR